MANGKLPSFDDVYQRYFDFVWSLTRRFGVEHSCADDVVQEIFLVIHTKLPTIRKPESMRSWIYGVVRRTVSDHYRTQRTKTATGTALAREVDIQYLAARTPADLAEQSEEITRFWRLVERIEPSKREIFVLAELEEMSVPEIAEALGIPLNTAYSRLRTARQLFEAGLARAVY